MRTRLLFFIKYATFWLVFFVFARLYFAIYNWDKTLQLTFSELFLTFIHGFKLDLSMMGYVLVLPLLVQSVLSMFAGNIFNKVMKIFTLVFLVLFAIIVIVDAELYRNWGFRIDSTIMLYVKTPKESLASITFGLFVTLTIAVAIITVTFFSLYKKIIEKYIPNQQPVNWFAIPLFIILSGSMIIPIRGGFGIAPINPGTVFFSKISMANHTALNCIWNFGNSLSTMNRKQTIKFMDDEVAKSNFQNIFKTDSVNIRAKIIDVEKPNVLLIILESFNAGVLKSLGGIDAAPNLDKIASEGILFSNFYANGDRSDKGIVSILSGYPAQPTTSIIKFTSKAEKLPHLSKKLASLGYSTGFYYGGEINFANMNSYFMSGEYEHLVTLDQFESSDLNSKWGAHDHVVFNRLFNDLQGMEQPFFRTHFTLSSHEPFDVPHQSHFNGTNEETKYLNSINYTDSCLGDFILKAKKTSWWNNTLIILVADHGSRWPGNVTYTSKAKFHIPMIWTGGAIEKDTLISSTCSQIDIPYMIGNQLGEDFSEFVFSKDVLKDEPPFAFYAFNNGFSFINDSAGFIYDNTANVMLNEVKTSENFIVNGKAFMQYLLNDFNNK